MRVEHIQVGGKTHSYIRESYRENGKVKKRTLAVVTGKSEEEIRAIMQTLQGRVSEHHPISAGIFGDHFEIITSLPAGHVTATLETMDRLGLPNLISTDHQRNRDICLALIAARIINPKSKLGTIDVINTCSLCLEFALDDLTSDQIYRAMDWLLLRQEQIEKELFHRHVTQGAYLFIDVTSSWFEGTKSPKFGLDGKERRESGCELPRAGYSRDKKKGKLQINIGLGAVEGGIPVMVRVYPGNTSDFSILMPMVDTAINLYDMTDVTIVGDRGMLSSKDIAIIESKPESLYFLSAFRNPVLLKSFGDMSKKIEQFEGRELFEFYSLEYPNQRMIVCLNPAIRKEKNRKRQSLIDATSVALDHVKARADAGGYKTLEQLGEAVGQAKDSRKVKKYFITSWADMKVEYKLNTEVLEREMLLSGIYVVRTSLPSSKTSAEETVRQYKKLGNVERTFRSQKTGHLFFRPYFHFTDDRIKAHALILMLAGYVVTHMEMALTPLTYADPEPELKFTRNPVLKPEKSDSAKRKEATGMVDENTRASSFDGVLSKLATSSISIVRVTKDGVTKEQLIRSSPSAYEIKVMKLLESIRSWRKPT
jgi:hypothetical protein